MNFNPCGQIIGTVTSVRRTRDMVLGMVEDYVEAIGAFAAGQPGRRHLTIHPRRASAAYLPARGWVAGG